MVELKGNRTARPPIDKQQQTHILVYMRNRLEVPRGIPSLGTISSPCTCFIATVEEGVAKATKANSMGYGIDS